jgi:hypothetical protein
MTVVKKSDWPRYKEIHQERWELRKEASKISLPVIGNALAVLFVLGFLGYILFLRIKR